MLISSKSSVTETTRIMPIHISVTQPSGHIKLAITSRVRSSWKGLGPEAAAIHTTLKFGGGCSVNSDAAWMALPLWAPGEPWELQGDFRVCVHMCEPTCMVHDTSGERPYLNLSHFRNTPQAHLAKPERCKPAIVCFVKWCRMRLKCPTQALACSGYS